MPINGERLKERFEAMAAIGATPGGGVDRQALTDADRRARDLLRSWMEEAGLAVRVDDVGTMYGRREGRSGDALPVALGSHLDSVHLGGRFDGAVGVLAALEVAETLRDQGIVGHHPLEVINFTNEEGSRFPPSMLASGVLAGAFAADYAYSRTDVEGISFGAALEAIGYRGDREARLQGAKAFLELHVEQGPVLERHGDVIGVVEGIQGITWMRVTVKGEANHAGTTPMDMRRDAMMAAARMITAARSALSEEGPDGRLTVGAVEEVTPGIINAIPAVVRFTVDLRHPDAAALDGVAGAFQKKAEAIAAEEGVEVAVDRFFTSPPVVFDAALVGQVEATARELGLSTRRLVSGAGHDAGYMSQLVPSAMIFVPSRGGRSHCEEEWTEWAHVLDGTRVLYHMARRLIEA